MRFAAAIARRGHRQYSRGGIATYFPSRYQSLQFVKRRIYSRDTKTVLWPFFYCALLRNAEVTTVAMFDGL